MSDYFSFPRPLKYDDLMKKAREIDLEVARLRREGAEDVIILTLAAKALAMRERAAQLRRGGV